MDARARQKRGARRWRDAAPGLGACLLLLEAAAGQGQQPRVIEDADAVVAGGAPPPDVAAINPQCAFPFLFAGELYNTCVTFDGSRNQKGWCRDGSGEWTECRFDAPNPASPGTEDMGEEEEDAPPTPAEQQQPPAATPAVVAGLGEEEEEEAPTPVEKPAAATPAIVAGLGGEEEEEAPTPVEKPAAATPAIVAGLGEEEVFPMPGDVAAADSEEEEEVPAAAPVGLEELAETKEELEQGGAPSPLGEEPAIDNVEQVSEMTLEPPLIPALASLTDVVIPRADFGERTQWWMLTPASGGVTYAVKPVLVPPPPPFGAGAGGGEEQLQMGFLDDVATPPPESPPLTSIVELEDYAATTIDELPQVDFAAGLFPSEGAPPPPPPPPPPESPEMAGFATDTLPQMDVVGNGGDDEYFDFGFSGWE